MDGEGILKLTFVDVSGNALPGKVDVSLQHTKLMSAAAEVKGFAGSQPLQITGLDSTQGGIYHLLVEPSKFRPVSQYVKILESQTTELSLPFPVDPSKIVRVDFPAYEALPGDLQTLLANSDAQQYPGKKGADLYQAMADVPKAGMFNLYSKMQHTTFDDGRNVFSYMRGLASVAGDRFFAMVEPELHASTKNSSLFHSVLDTLHSPLIGFSPVDSYKTFDHYGNLQLTFSQNQAGDYMVDADIDDAQGIEHIFQVARNAVRGPTNPFDIHEILIEDQKIDPGYILEV